MIKTGKHEQAAGTSMDKGNLVPDLKQSYADAQLGFVPDKAFGPLEGYARGPDGEPVSQYEFALYYATAAQRITEAARRLIQEDRDQLPEKISGLERDFPITITDEDVKRRSAGRRAEEIQAEYEQLIRTEIVRLGQPGISPSDPELRYRAACLALAALNGEHEERRLSESLSSGSAILQEQALLLAAAREKAGPGASALQVMAAFVTAVKEKHNYVPELRVYHDYDGNLTDIAHEGSPLKPGEATNQLLNPLEEIIGLKGDYRVRLVLTECPGLNSDRRLLARACFEEVHGRNHVFTDVPALFSLLNEGGYYHEVFTANNLRVPLTTLRRLKQNCSDVRGLSPVSFFDTKVNHLISELAGSPRLKVLVMSDDDEGSLARHIKAGHQSGPYLPQLIFFSSRVGDPPNGRSFRVAQALKEHGFPFVENKAHEGMGLKGLRSFVEAYAAVRESLGE